MPHDTRQQLPGSLPDSRVPDDRDKPAPKHLPESPAEPDGEAPGKDAGEGQPQTLAQLAWDAKEDVLRKLMEKLDGKASMLAANLKLTAHQKAGEGVPASGEA